MNKKHKGKVVKGKFKPDNQNEFIQAFYMFEGKEVCVTVSKVVKSRSKNQNSYMHGVVYKLISDFNGYTVDEVHDEMRLLFWYKIGKTGIKIPRSTKEHTTATMEEYLSNIRMWASEQGVYIPEPNEVEF